ncbi:MAG: YHS domain-containing protein, partial [Armatimonadetes bacterium]|nr:YHS domain-containing protein [Armatimonadota bacterium]
RSASKEAAAGTSTHNGKTYYFCCAGCKSTFEKDPEKYVTKK